MGAPVETGIKRRIGILLHDGGAGGGSERVARRLGQAWRREGRDVTLLVGDPADQAKWNGPDPLPLLTPDRPIARGPGSRRRLGRWAGEAARHAGIDAIYLPGNFHFAAVPALARAAGPDVRLVAVLSNPVRRLDRTGVRQWVWERRVAARLRPVHRLVALSDALAAEARAIMPADRLTVIAQPILPDEPSSPSAPPFGPPLVLGIGRLVAQKNWPLLLHALALLPPGVRLRLVGEGPLRSELEALAEQLGLGNRTSFAGQVADVAGELANAHLVAISSDYETGPAVAVEALAAGRPVVATRCSPSIGELVPDGHGVIVPPRDSRALADAIAAVLAGPPPPVTPAWLEQYRIGPIARAWLGVIDGG